jgi:molybdopterin-binding protein
MSIQAINVRNQFRGKVKEIIRGDVVSEIDVETPWGIVTSVITTRSVDQLELAVGTEVVALVKSTEVSIAKLWSACQAGRLACVNRQKPLFMRKRVRRRIFGSNLYQPGTCGRPAADRFERNYPIGGKIGTWLKAFQRQ